ncbi:MAG: polysaccharide biosynthesis C-terminal domain-containing protein [Lachnospiraceae bacterium]|nr:polysaccharide biosynthesis C-terminal domain-containing protein [Lachnospiraceae bacterium]
MKIHKRDVSVKGRNRRVKNNVTVYAGIITYMIGLFIRIPLSRVIGDAGIGLAAPALELSFLATFIFSYGISRTMTGLIRYRIKREQYKSAQKVFHMAFKVALLWSVLLAAVLFVCSGFFSEIIVLEAMSRKAVIAAAPVILLSGMLSVFRGYFNGNGFAILVSQSQYIEKIAMLVCMLAGGGMVYGYGEKVAALLQNPMVAYAYGALGAILGFMIAELITLIYLLFVFGIYSGTWKSQLMQDSGRRLETNGEIIGMLFGNGFPAAVIVVLLNLFMLIDQRFFNYCMNRTGQGEMRTALWGAYYGKFAVLIGLGCALVCLAVHGYVGKIAMAYEKEEYRMMRDRIGSAVKKLCITAFPIAIYLAVLAEPFVKGIYKGENGLAIDMLRRGTIIVIFYGIAYLFGQLMLKLHMTKELFLSCLIALAVHLAAVYLLVRKALLGGNGVVYSVILFTGVLAVLCFLFLARKLKYRQEWVIPVAFPALAACVAGLVVMLLNKLLLGMAGELLTILVSCLVGTVLYVILLMVLRVLNEGEIAKFPFGSLFITLGRMIGVL